MSRKARAEAPSVPVSLRLSVLERQRVTLAASVCRQTFAEFCRDALLGAAEDCLESPPVTIRITESPVSATL